MELCLIHANCQGEPLADLLHAHPGFAARWRCRVVLNYAREPVPQDALDSCTLFLCQHLGAKWGDLASDALLARLNPAARSLFIPSMFWKGCWPLWTSDPAFNYSDRLLDELLGRGLARQEVLHLYLRTDPARYFDLDALAEASLVHERAKEERSDVKYVDAILARWRDEQLFFTVNHPRKTLLRLVADGVCQRLGLDPLSEAAYSAAPEGLSEFELPVHPAVARRFSLAWAGPQRLWRVHGREMTFAEYAAHYVNCKLLGEKDFIGYLLVVAGRAGSAERTGAGG